jgi:hypothetical protein
MGRKAYRVSLRQPGCRNIIKILGPRFFCVKRHKFRKKGCYMSMIRSLSISFLTFLVIVSLAGCGSGGGSVSSAGGSAGSGSGSGSSSSNPPAGGSGGGATTTGVAKLSWNAPTNADGTPVTGIAGFKVHYGTSPGTYSSSVNVGMTTSYSVNGLAPGTYYFTVTDYDSTGNESGYSNEASKIVL